MKRVLVLIMCLATVMSAFYGCKEVPTTLDSEFELETEKDTDTGKTSDAEEVKLSSVSIGGADISEYRIVYATASSREQCFEDIKIAAEMLKVELKDMLGVELVVVPDTETKTDREIILGVAFRAECIRYSSGDTALKPDQYYIAMSGKNLLLGADCLAGVVDACEVFIEHLKGEAVKGNANVDITGDFDISGEKHITRIACVGDSITQGVDASDEIKESYPAVLQNTLGYEYDVVNYGKGGTTMSSYSLEIYKSRSYIDKSTYYDTLIKTAPKLDVVIIMLGSNDAAGSVESTELFTKNYDAFKMDFTINLTKMVKDLRKANDDIKIIYFSTTKCHPENSTREQNLVKYVRPLQKQLCEDLKLDFYDMYQYTAKNMTASEYEDGLHPLSVGYKKMGIEAARVLKDKYGFQ